MIVLILPIADENPREGKPWVTWGLMAAISLAGLLLASSPAATTGALLSPLCPSTLADWALALLFLWIFADNVEDRFGAAAFAPFWLVTCWLGVGLSSLTLKSGLRACGVAYGTSAVVGAYVTLFPRHYVKLANLFPLLFAPRSRGLWAAFDDGDRPDVTTHFVRAVWVAVLWAAFGLLLAGFDPRIGLLGLAGAGGAGALSAWVGRRVFGIRVADAPLPDELAPPDPVSRRRAAPREETPAPVSARPSPPPAPRPGESFLEVEPAPDGGPASAPGDGGRTGCAVIRLTEDLADVSLLGRIVAGHTGEYLADVTRRLRATRGLIVRQADEEVARRLAGDLKEQGIETAVLDLARTPPLPAPRLIAGAGCSAEGVEFELREGERVKLAWPRIGLIAAGQIERRRTIPLAPQSTESGRAATTHEVRETLETLIDFVVRAPLARFRLSREDANFRLMTEPGAPVGAGELGFKRFVRGLVQHRGATPINTGVKVLDGGGRWGYLRFRADRDFDDYGWWLLQLLSHRRTQAEQAAFLE